MKTFRVLISTLLSWSLISIQSGFAADWPTFGGNLASQKYSVLDQINASNFHELENGAYLWSIDAKTGLPDRAFGDDGKLDLTEGLRREVIRGEFAVNSPPLVIVVKLQASPVLSAGACRYKEIDVGNFTYKPEGDLEMHRFTKRCQVSVRQFLGMPSLAILTSTVHAQSASDPEAEALAALERFRVAFNSGDNNQRIVHVNLEANFLSSIRLLSKL